MSVDLEKIRREQIRWFLLLGLNNARPEGLHEKSLFGVVRAVYPDVTVLEVRRHLDYLEGCGLVKLTKAPDGVWHAILLRKGIDLCEYTVACEPGIERPEKYWGSHA